tara:strand:+ start:173 stop:331 length:159 start_codon:yes stop_codon:yes gene_type:complete
MRTIEEIKEMDFEDLKDELGEQADFVKYCHHSTRDLEYLRMLEREYNNRFMF